MESSVWRAAFRRSGHVVAYGLTVVIGYFAAGDVLSYFFDRFGPDGLVDGNPFIGILVAIVQGGFAVLFAVLAAAAVFVAIVGVGGAVLSQAWGRLATMVLDRSTGE